MQLSLGVGGVGGCMYTPWICEGCDYGDIPGENCEYRDIIEEGHEYPDKPGEGREYGDILGFRLDLHCLDAQSRDKEDADGL